jgi:tetratricopeptide (TPR) repeat protein
MDRLNQHCRCASLRWGKGLAWFVSVFLFLAPAVLLFGQVTTVQDEMRAGMLAYQFSDYQGAANHFRAALALNPDLTQARFYLATSIAQQYVPGVESAANMQLATQAIEDFKMVLDDDPPDQERYRSVVSIASMSFNLKQLAASREYYEKAIELEPGEARNYFSIAVIDWTEASKSRAKMREQLHLTESEMISAPAACASLRTEIENKVEDGIRRLQKALELQPAYDDAMGYMNLLYRERAEYECDNPESRKADLKAADEWVDKAIAAKKPEAVKPTPPQR